MVIEGVNDGPVHVVAREWLLDRIPKDWVVPELHPHPDSEHFTVSHTLWLQLPENGNV